MIDYNNYANIILFIANIVNVTKTKITPTGKKNETKRSYDLYIL